MRETADVVIIGGGIVGASVAYHLAEAGYTNVRIVERETAQGLGSTGRATGGVRAQFATAVNIRMSRYSIDFISHFEEATGHPSGYDPAGYLFVATNERQLQYLKETGERQRSEGLTNVEIVSAADIRRMMPQLRADDIVGGSFCQTDGFVVPLSILRGFSERAFERGVRLWLETEVTGIEVEGGSVSRVLTTRGAISTRAVVNATGAWAANVARLAGVEIPITPLRRQLVCTKPLAEMPARFPMVIDMSDGFHFRPDSLAGASPGVLLAWPDPEEEAGFESEFDERFAEKLLPRAVSRVPCLAGAEIDEKRCRAGLYEVTPDHHAIIGEAPGVRGLFLANGFSGHGVMHSPATGLVMSELILEGQARSLDVSALGAERFTSGRLLEETSVI
ncbi:MAG: FAD-binding oxidoreductase [Pyrinomonadaceae bacterium]|nr:FAD-binding oxidoreductase [Pyrinomonadaceae bacterium]